MFFLHYSVLVNTFGVLSQFYKTVKLLLIMALMVSSPLLYGQGSRLSIQCKGPSNLSICGINDSAFVEIYNISSGTVNNLVIKLTLSPGIKYVRNSVSGGGVAESNMSNLNQPEFTAPNLAVAKNFKFRLLLTADCDLLPFLSSGTPVVACRVNYTGNFDFGNSIPFPVKVPSAQFGTITGLSFTGDVGDKFMRSISIGNFGKGPLRELRLVRINGKDVQTFYVSKGNTTYSGDTVTTVFNAAFFKTIGNNDTFLDQNETIVFTDSNIIKGCKLLNTAFELSWGCGGKRCQVSKTSGTVLISNKVPVLKALPFPVTNTCFNRYNYKTEIRFVNTGNMPAVAPRVAISLNYPYVQSKFDTASIRIRVGSRAAWVRAVKDSTTLTYNLGNYACIGPNAIGFFRIKSPDLKPNDTLFVTWNTESCTVAPCSNASMLMNSWAYYAEYKDQCRNTRTIPWTWGKVYDQHYLNSTSFIPTDLVNNQTGEFRTLISSASMLPRAAGATYVVDLIVPKALIHSRLKKDFYFINADLNAYWNPDSIVQKGDTVRAYFPHPVPISLTNSELVYYLKADCSKAGANGMQTIKLQFRYMPDKNCNPKEWLYLSCQSMQLKIHCKTTCAGGLIFKNFSVQRISFGQPDNNNDGIPDASGTLDTLKIREERCFTGDTIEASFHGVVKRTSSIISWRNAYVETTITNGKPLEVAGVDLYVWRRGVTLSQICSSIKNWKTVSGNNATFKFDLSTDSIRACVSSGFRYSTDDSLIVKVRFRVNTNIGGASQNLLFNNRFYTSNINNPTSNANKFQCDTFSGQMIMSGYYFTTCCSDLIQLNSCNQLVVSNSFYMGIGPCCSNYGGNNYFPFEYRNFAKIKSLKFYIPPGFKLKASRFTQYRTAGSNKIQTQFTDSIKPASLAGSPYMYNTGKFYKDSAGGVINLSDDAFHGTFQAWIEPSCEIQSMGNIPLKYDFVFERRGILGNGFDTIKSGITDQIVYNKPVTVIKPSSPIIYAAQDTAEWELVYTNYSAAFSNINTWFAPDNSGAIKIVQIKDASKDTLLPLKNGIFKAGTIPFNQTRKFKVRAIYNSCNKDSIILYSGWNCAGYPADLATYNCYKERVALYLEPQNTQYQSSLTDSVSVADLCANTPYTLTIENTGTTTGYNTRAYVNLPIGMSIVPGSCYMRYPAAGGKISIPVPVLKSGTVYEWNLASISSAIGAGFKGVGDVTKNKIIIYFRVKTDCNYSSGNYIRAGGTGNIKCGDPIPSYPSISNPLNIKGVTRPYYTLLKTESDSIFPCEKPSKFRVKIINLGPSVTGSEDKYQVVLLPGMSFDSSMYSGLYNAPDNKLTVSRNINGATEVEFSLPDSIAAGDSMAFEFGYHANGARLNCGSTEIYSQAAVKQEVTCVSDNSKCKINVVTGNSLVKTPLVKSLLGFNSLKAVLDSISANTEHLSIGFNIKNNGDRVTASRPIILKYLYDANGSGTADKGDSLLAMDTLSVTLEKNATTAHKRRLNIRAGYSCALLVSLDSGSCSCVFGYARFPVPALKNAGKSVQICSGDTVQFGMKPVSAFRYIWSPGGELSADTVANPSVRLDNNDSSTISKRYILTTYRGTCSSKDTVQADIFKLPAVSIRQNDTVICAAQKVALSAAATGGNGSYTVVWKPAAGLSDALAFTPLATPLSSTVYTIHLKDARNCKAGDSVKITVKPLPVAHFTFAEACQGLPLMLTDSSYVGGDALVFRRWTGQGLDTLNTDTLQINLGSSLSGSMSLEVKTASGCADTISKPIFLNPLPQAAFTTANRCFGDTVVTHNHSKVISGIISKNSWNMGDGNYYTSDSVKHKYAMPDTFSLMLMVETNKKCRDTAYGNVTVYNRPSATFSVSGVCHGDSSHTVNNSSIQNDSIVQYLWLSSGNSSADKQAAFLYPGPGTYGISLLTVSRMGCRDSFSALASVYENPNASFSAAPVCAGDSSRVVSGASIGSGSISSWNYRLSDGASYSSRNFSHRFAAGDTFRIEQIVVSDRGCRDTFNRDVLVYPALFPSFTVSDVCLLQDIQISDKTTFLNTGIKSWKYELGNGDSALVQNPVYRYGKWGSYGLRQTVVSNENCRYESSGKVTVYPLPRVSFYDSNKCVDNRFEFNSVLQMDTGTVQSLLWDFGDNDSATLANPVHIFPGAGNYRVKLKAVSDFGCADSAERTVQSYPPVLVNFSAGNVCLGDPVRFINLSVAPNSSIISSNWDFGDGDTSVLKDPLHKYQNPGIYNVRLKVKSAYNCSYDTVGYVEVYPVPEALFANDPDQGSIVNPEISITDLSTGADTILYDLGDGKTSYQRNLIKSYPDSGTFLIRQIATNHFGCRDTFSKTIRIKFLFVFYAPTAFSPNNDGNNDVYAPGGIGTKSYKMSIFNRWGELVYETNNSEPWDGTYKGEPVMEGIYAVTFKVRDFKGIWHYYSTSFVLLR